MRVLVAEAEDRVAEGVTAALRRAALTVDTVHDGSAALAALRQGAYDVLVLDQELTGPHADEICRHLAEQGLPTRVLLLTAPGAGQEPAEDAEPGAGHRLARPFAHEDLLGRVLTLGRPGRPVRPQVIERAGVSVDTARRLALRDGRPLALSRTEFGVLEVLLRAQGAPVSGDELIEEVWEEHTSYRTNAVRVALGRLRAKLGDPPVIETVPGGGYRMGDGAAAEGRAGTESGTGPGGEAAGMAPGAVAEGP
ncbi:response regulator transcription factor [Streptomyces angustmyceticus]|uniref:response regulator transcription factor n=1 Tax=Streptomyces angustmyceticus TaxID=285578 RepID=UPI0021AF56C2|nr:response regulator transcription factor [Streptomyces angustmyceticus]